MCMSSSGGNKELIKKFELCSFWKEIKLQLTFWHYLSNLLFVNCIFLGYSSLNFSSTIRYLKLKEMPKYKHVPTWQTYIFALCFWLGQNYMKICFKNISSAKLQWKKCARGVKHNCFFCIMLHSSWISLSASFVLWLIFLVSAFFCKLLPSA